MITIRELYGWNQRHYETQGIICYSLFSPQHSFLTVKFNGLERQMLINKYTKVNHMSILI